MQTFNTKKKRGENEPKKERGDHSTCRVTVDVIKPKAYSPTRGWRIIATSLKAVVFWSTKKVSQKPSLEHTYTVCII